jgi:hypothetical protein
MVQDRRFAAATALALLVHVALLMTIAAMQKAPLSGRQAMLVDVSVQRDTPEYQELSELFLGVRQASSATDSSHVQGSVLGRQIVGRNGPGRRAVSAPVLSAGRSDSESPGAGDLQTDRSESPNALSLDARDAQEAGEKSPLTLEQLGIGEKAATPREESPLLRDAKRRLAQSRKLQLSLVQDATTEASRIGLGPASPILAEFEQLVQQSSLASNGWANIHARLLDSGAIEIELLSSSSERERWTRLLASAQQHLAVRKLQPPKGSRGIDLEIRVESRVQLPSGHDPGFSAKLFGLTLKKGEGKRSSGIELLSSLPRVEMPEDEDSNPSTDPVRKAPRLVLDLFKLAGDPADIGAKRRRLVSARVTRQTVL